MSNRQDGGQRQQQINPRDYVRHPNETVRDLARHAVTLGEHMRVLDRDRDDLRAQRDAAVSRADRAHAAEQGAKGREQDALRGKERAEQNCRELTQTVNHKDAEIATLKQKIARLDQEKTQLKEENEQRVQQMHAHYTAIQQQHAQTIHDLKHAHSMEIQMLQQQLSAERNQHHIEKVQLQGNNEVEKKELNKRHQAQIGEHKHTEKTMDDQIRELTTKINIYSHINPWDVQPSPVSQPSELVANGSLVYFRDGENIHQLSLCPELQWTTLPDCSLPESSLGVVREQLVAVGGVVNERSTNQIRLFDVQRTEWVDWLPSMPTARSHALIVSTERALVVAGGQHRRLFTKPAQTDAVEVLNVDSKVWYKATSLPWPVSRGTHTATLCGHQICVFPVDCPEGVITSLPEQLYSVRNIQLNWQRTMVDSRLKVKASYTFNGKLFAVCADHTKDENDTVYLFDKTCNCWQIVDPFIPKYKHCLATAIHDGKLMIVGVISGQTKIATKTLKRVHVKLLYKHAI